MGTIGVTNLTLHGDDVLVVFHLALFFTGDFASCFHRSSFSVQRAFAYVNRHVKWTFSTSVLGLGKQAEGGPRVSLEDGYIKSARKSTRAIHWPAEVYVCLHEHCKSEIRRANIRSPRKRTWNFREKDSLSRLLHRRGIWSNQCSICLSCNVFFAQTHNWFSMYCPTPQRMKK